jgi:hypothetical protein
MFETIYTVQIKTLLFEISIVCSQLLDNDEPIAFDLSTELNQWWIDDKDYKTTPNAITLGVWLKTMELLKQDKLYSSRNLTCKSVLFESPSKIVRFTP